MFTIIKEFLTSSTFRKYFLIVIIILGFFIAGGITCNRIYSKGYCSGVEHQKVVYQAQIDRINQDNKATQKKADDERDELNKQIISLKQKSIKDQQEITAQTNTLQEKLSQYEKNNSTTNAVCIPSNDDGLRLLNESFPR